MPANITPSDWLGAGFTVDAGNHLIKLTTSNAAGAKALPQLTDAKANPTTGDVREIAFALCHALYEAWLAQLNLPTPNRTQNMNMQRSVSPGGGLNDNITLEFRMQFTVDPTGVFAIPDET